MIVQTSFFESTKEDVARFIDYLDKGYQMEDDLGREVDEASKSQFAESAERFDTARMATISPTDGDEMGDWEHMTATHRAMREYTKGRYSIRYLAALHRDTDYDHVQLCMLGNEDEIEMGKDDLDEFKQSIIEQYNEREIELVQERLDGRSVDEVTDEQAGRLGALQQTTLPDPAQEASQIELDESLDRVRGGGR